MNPESHKRPARIHWSDAALHWRDRLLGSPRFRAWAEGVWPARWVARRRAAQLFHLVAGFAYSQVLLACVQLGVFELLASQGPLTLAELARHLGLGLPATERLVQAAAALRLLQARPQARWGLGPLGAPLVNNPGLSAMVAHHPACYRDLADPVALLRGDAGAGHLSQFWPYADSEHPGQLEAARVAAYSDLMAASQPLVAQQVLRAYSFQRHQHLLDVGGGEGAFACAVAARVPHLRIQVFDLPAVAERARGHFDRLGLGPRCQAVGGDFLCDALPAGADLISLVRVVHDHDDERVFKLLAAVRRALRPGGRLLIAEPLADTSGAEAMGHAYFGFYLLAMGRGQARSAARLREMLQHSGFRGVRQLRTPMPLQTGLLLATAA
jgi:demethylspheroidene O-methyltransferase